MKKCPECEREIDKYGIACEYCGKLDELSKTNQKEKTSEANSTDQSGQ